MMSGAALSRSIRANARPERRPSVPINATNVFELTHIEHAADSHAFTVLTPAEKVFTALSVLPAAIRSPATRDLSLLLQILYGLAIRPLNRSYRNIGA